MLIAVPVMVWAMVPAYAQVGSVVSHTMAKGIDESTKAPTVNATEFLTTDEAAYSWFEIRMEIFGPITFNWKWYEPTGSIHRDESKIEWVSEKGRIHRLWDTLRIMGAPPAVKNGTWRVEVFARVDKLFDETFSIQPPETTYKVAVGVSGFGPNYSATVYVDGASKGAIAGGSSKEFTFDKGTSHAISVDQIVSGDAGTRYRCATTSWTATSKSSYTFAYDTEYYLTVVSEYGTKKGEGWYRAGDTATFSVDSRVAGSVGVQYVFERWSGHSTSMSPQATIVMDGPKRVTAVWIADYTQFHLIVTIIAASAAILAVIPIVASRRRVPKTRGPALPRPGPPALTCNVCGKPTIYVSRTNRHYCTSCKRYL